MNILGISAFYHESVACLMQDGKIILAEEVHFNKIDNVVVAKVLFNYLVKNIL